MSLRERTQNPVIGDTVKLRLYVYNSNHRQDVHKVKKVDIYYLDPELVSETNLDGRRLVETIPGVYKGEWNANTNNPILVSGIGNDGDYYIVSVAGTTDLDGIAVWNVGDWVAFNGIAWTKILAAQATEIIHEGEGEYSVTVTLADTVYTIGDYRDVWELEIEEDQPVSHIENRWQVLPDLWYAGPEPILYDFSFGFRPNRIRVGSKQYLTVDVRPNVPTAPDLDRYYKMLAIATPLKISIEMACGECVPAERDLRLIVDNEAVPMRKTGEAYYFLDTVALELDCGMYNVWFEMDFGESKFLSEKLQLQIFD